MVRLEQRRKARIVRKATKTCRPLIAKFFFGGSASDVINDNDSDQELPSKGKASNGSHKSRKMQQRVSPRFPNEPQLSDKMDKQALTNEAEKRLVNVKINHKDNLTGENLHNSQNFAMKGQEKASTANQKMINAIQSAGDRQQLPEEEKKLGDAVDLVDSSFAQFDQEE